VNKIIRLQSEGHWECRRFCKSDRKKTL